MLGPVPAYEMQNEQLIQRRGEVGPGLNANEDSFVQDTIERTFEGLFE